MFDQLLLLDSIAVCVCYLFAFVILSLRVFHRFVLDLILFAISTARDGEVFLKRF